MSAKTKFFIGIDVSKLWFDASLMAVVDHLKQTMETERFDNNEKGIKAFEKWLKRFKVTFDEQSLLVMENTGIYHRMLWAFCGNRNLPLYIGNAAHIKWSFGIARGKNDVIDSKRLCGYAQKHAEELKVTPGLNPVLMQLKDLMTVRTKLLSHKNSIKVHIQELKNVNDKTVQKELEQVYHAPLKAYEKSLKEVAAKLAAIIDENSALKGNYKLLLTVPGIGKLTAIYMICCTGNFTGGITGKQLACYAGVVPFEQTSGSSIRGKNKVHKMANKDLKKLLHMGALSAIQAYPEFRNYYERKKEEGKHNLSVLNAIKNKMVLRAVAVVNNKKPYVDNTKIAA